MSERQMRAMIKFHAKAEKAYRESGQPEQADRARKLREELERRLTAEA